jgi:hypothetical protein
MYFYNRCICSYEPKHHVIYISVYLYVNYINSKENATVSPKFQNLSDYVDWLEKLLNQYGSAERGYWTRTPRHHCKCCRLRQPWEQCSYPITRADLKDFKYIYHVLYYASYYDLYILVSLYIPSNYRYICTHLYTMFSLDLQ